MKDLLRAGASFDGSLTELVYDAIRPGLICPRCDWNSPTRDVPLQHGAKEFSLFVIFGYLRLDRSEGKLLQNRSILWLPNLRPLSLMPPLPRS